MEDKNSVKFIGRRGLIFTDEDGIRFCVHIKTLSSGEYDMVLYSKDIRPLDIDRKLNDNERETIVSKILELTKDIKWQIKNW